MTDIIQDPEMGAENFTILRRRMILSDGEAEYDETETIAVSGAVHPAKEEELSLLPEEYRTQTVMTFYAPVRFSLGSRTDAVRFTEPDRIRYGGREFLVISVKDWMAFGFSRAIAVEKTCGL